MTKSIMLPTPGFSKQVADVGALSLRAYLSGEITATNLGNPIGISDIDGYVKNVWIAAEEGGRDDTDDLYVDANVKIDGTTCLTTKPRILANNGSASQKRNTYQSGERVVVAVLNSSVISVSRGDSITVDWELTRTTPDTEMANFYVVVELSAS